MVKRWKNKKKKRHFSLIKRVIFLELDPTHLCTAALCLCSGTWWFWPLFPNTPRKDKEDRRGPRQNCGGVLWPRATAGRCSRRIWSRHHRWRSGGQTPAPRQTRGPIPPPHLASALGRRWARSHMLSWQWQKEPKMLFQAHLSRGLYKITIHVMYLMSEFASAKDFGDENLVCP